MMAVMTSVCNNQNVEEDHQQQLQNNHPKHVLRNQQNQLVQDQAEDQDNVFRVGIMGFVW